MADSPFTWGAGGAQMTPEQIAAQKKVAQAMMAQGMDYSPIQSPWQGVARVAQGLLGGYVSGEADRATAKNAAADREMIASLINGGGTPAAASTPTGSTAPVTATPSVSTPMGATTIPGGRDEFVSSVTPAAVEASKSTGLDPRLIVAQAALESGYGQHAPGNNLFGIKSHGQPGGNVLPTTEVVNGQPVQTTDSFRAYASPQDSVKGYADFINSNPRYAAVKNAQGLDNQITALGQSGYATDPQYGAKIRQIASGMPAIPMPGGANNPLAANEPSPLDTAQYPAGPVGGPQDAAALPPNAQPAGPAQAAPQVAAAPVAAAPAAAPARPAINPALITAVTSPYASPATKAIAQILLKNQMAAPEYVPIGDNAILDKKTGRVVPVDVNKKTNEIRDYETYSAQAKSAGQEPMPFLDYQTKLKEAGKPVTNINQQQESEYQKATGKHFADLNNTIATGAIRARGEVATLNRLGSLLADPNVYQGKGGEAILEAKRLAKLVGIDVGDLGGAEAVRAIQNQYALELRNPSGGAGMPGAMSDKDREFLQSIPPGLERTREGNQQIAEYRKKVAERSIQVDRLRQQYVKENGRLDEGFYQRLAEYSDANPLFPETTAPAGNKTKSGVTWSVE